MNIEGLRGARPTPSDAAPQAGPTPAIQRHGDLSHGAGGWREYEYLSDLYKFYLDLIVKGTGGYFLVVGGILTLVLANVRDEPIVVVSLLVPVLMSILLALAAWQARRKVKELQEAISVVTLSMNVALKPHVEILEWAVKWTSRLLVIAALLLAGLFTGSWLPREPGRVGPRRAICRFASCPRDCPRMVPPSRNRTCDTRSRKPLLAPRRVPKSAKSVPSGVPAPI